MQIVILTGAGISAESGLGTFRDVDGIWTKYPLEDLATPEGFAKNPEFVQGFYNARRSNGANAEPNAAHRALARLQAHAAQLGGWVVVVTQNIDDLHERGGSPEKMVLHMHGEINKSRCTACEHVAPCSTDITMQDVCSNCGSEGTLRPHVVWFGEMPFYLEEIEALLSDADVFVSIGTSGEVYPAAGFVAYANRLRKHTVELNLEPSSNARDFREVLYGKATEIVPQWVDDLIAKAGR
ncbi:MAG: NAD-dependent deacylase [Pseudomonadota bacterium]